MKKLAFIAVLGLCSVTAFSQVADPAQQTSDPTQQTTDPTHQTSDPTQPQTTNPTQGTVEPTEQMTTDPTERRTADHSQQTAEQETTAQSQDGYNPITKKELPKEVKKSIKENYPKAKIEECYVNEEGQYKLEVTLQDGTSETMFVDKEGTPMGQ